VAPDEKLRQSNSSSVSMMTRRYGPSPADRVARSSGSGENNEPNRSAGRDALAAFVLK
jgi:hypothetical protein